MAENFTKYLVDYFKNKLSSGKDIKCKNCKKNKKFISQVNDNGNIELIYTCGETDKGKCGVQYGLILPQYINYDTELDTLLKSIYTPTNYGSMERNDIKIDIDYEKNQIENKKNFDELKKLFDNYNKIENKEKLTTQFTKEKNDKLKHMNKLYKEIKEETDEAIKKEKIKSYLELKKEIDDINKYLREIKQSIHIVLKVSDGEVVDSITIKKPVVKEKVKEKEKVVYENNEVEIELYELTDIDKFSKRKDVFDIGKEDECKESVSWEELKHMRNKTDYSNKLKEISTNPEYITFNQIYFTAADVMQFQKYGYLKTRILSYPSYTKSKYHIYNRYNVDTTYKTFQYIFHNLKKGVEELLRHISDLTKVVHGFMKYQMKMNQAVSTHTHLSPFYGIPTAPSEQCMQSGFQCNLELTTKTETSVLTLLTNLVGYDANYLKPTGPRFICSQYNNTN